MVVDVYAWLFLILNEQSPKQEHTLLFRKLAFLGQNYKVRKMSLTKTLSIAFQMMENVSLLFNKFMLFPIQKPNY